MPNDLYVRRGDGPENARVMIVGEAFGENEESQGVPFVGYSGQLLNSMLHEAGIMRSECYLTNVVNARPPGNDITKWVPSEKSDVSSKHIPLRGKMVLPIVKAGFDSLVREINTIKPDLIIALGNTPLWALCGQSGVTKWRGSQLTSDVVAGGVKVIPTIHPAAILREYGWRQIAVQDLRRAASHRYPGPYRNQPDWSFIIRPSFSKVIEVLRDLRAQCDAAPMWLEADIETTPKHISCIGLSWSRTHAICIPILHKGGFADYWSLDEEAAVIYELYLLLTHENCWVRMQNGLYDCQHIHRWWHFIPNVKQDTMLSHHSMWCGMKKSLDFQASMYTDYYSYWKDMHRDQSNKAGA